MLGGHDIVGPVAHLARPWQCRCCHKTATKRAVLACSRCPGSAAKRWANASSAATGSSPGGGHCLLLTGTIVWCWKCGANACVRARHLALPCRGRPRGFLLQARQRLMIGLHPSSRVPLNADTVPVLGQMLPVGFTRGVEEAEVSRTVAASPRRQRVPDSLAAKRSLATTPRLVALRERVLAQEALAKQRCLRTAISPKRRLHGKQPDPGRMRS